MRCERCGGSESKMVVIDRVEHCVSEYDIRCRRCGDLIEWWAYGVWNPDGYEQKHYPAPLRLMWTIWSVLRDGLGRITGSQKRD